MTEIAGVGTFFLPSDHRDSSKLRSGGRACAHAELRVIGTEHEPAQPGVIGEIAIRSGGVMQGYWNQPEQSAAVLVDGWVHTGDAGYPDEQGYLFEVDRIKDMIVTGGENVYSAEVENVLSSHDGIVECAVVGVADEHWGERVHAIVVLSQGFALTDSEIRDFVKARIAGYKAPRTVDFVDALPRTSTGEILKRMLRDGATRRVHSQD